MKTCLILLVLFANILIMNAEDLPKHSVQREQGFVPDESTAVHIAEAVLIPIYGQESIKKERPFKATLTNETWIVKGTLPKGSKGGVAVVELSKKDACVLRVSHGK